MTDGGILDGLDKATGGDGAGAKGAKSKGKKSKKTKPILIISGVGAAVLVYYLYSKHQANTASSAATDASSIDPSTGIPYADETGSDALDPSTGVPYSEEVGSNGSTTSSGSASASDPFQVVDPTSASGETYAQELGANTGDLSTLTQDVGDLQATVATTQNSQDALQSSWETGLYSALTQAGVTGDQAAQDVQNYLNGQPLDSTAAVSAINGYVANAGASPGPGGSSLVAVLANGAKQVTGGGDSPSSTSNPLPADNYKAPGIVTNANGSTDAAAVASLSAANAKLKSEQATGTAKQVAAARTNAQNAAKVVESRNKAAS